MGRPLPKIDPARLLAQTDWVLDLARSLVDPVHAEDVSQEAILIALRHPPRAYEDEPGLRAWLRRVVVNLVHRQARAEGHRHLREERAARPESQPSVLDTVERASQVRMVVDAVTDLEEPYRAAVLLRYFDQRSAVEVAKMIDESPAAVRKRVSRGLDKLRARLETEHGSEHRAWLLGLAGLSGGRDVRGSPGSDAPLLTSKMAAALVGAILVVLPLVAFLSQPERHDSAV